MEDAREVVETDEPKGELKLLVGDKEFPVKCVKPVVSARQDFIKIQFQANAANAELAKEYADVIDVSESEMNAQRRIRFNEYLLKIEELTDSYFIKYCERIINWKSVEPEVNNARISNEDEFWQQQDSNNLMAIVNFFRKRARV